MTKFHKFMADDEACQQHRQYFAAALQGYAASGRYSNSPDGMVLAAWTAADIAMGQFYERGGLAQYLKKRFDSDLDA